MKLELPTGSHGVSAQGRAEKTFPGDDTCEQQPRFCFGQSESTSRPEEELQGPVPLVDPGDERA